MGGERMDYCECCGKVEVFDGKVCRECEERIARNLAAAMRFDTVPSYNVSEEGRHNG